MDEQKQSLIDRIKQAQNVLVTVSTNPSVDQLAAAIGLTLALNKMDKHGTAVFSGEVPSTLDFLKPEETLEKNTDSLRDFIIALDKSKADKLRYKVEDNVVRIFITPYRSSLSQDDLQFSQGDFNVDVVVALGVTQQQDLDAAITAHGRILHDATVATVSTTNQGELGTLNWVDPGASSLSEMVVTLVDGLDKKALDNQISTALLTGIVASTERFSNDKTSPRTMSVSAELMAAGANQQLIATELAGPGQAMPAPEPPKNEGKAAPTSEKTAEAEPAPPRQDPGTLEIDHQGEPEESQEAEKPVEPEEKRGPQVHVDENGQLITEDALPAIGKVRGTGPDGTPTESGSEPPRERMVEPPKFSTGNLTANTKPESFEPSTEDLTRPAASEPLLSHDEPKLGAQEPPKPEVVLPPVPPAPTPAFTPPPPPVPPVSTPGEPAITDSETLSEIESSVDSPHAQAPAAPAAAADDVDSARSAVEAALKNGTSPAPLDPITALNAQPLGQDLHATPVPDGPLPGPSLPPAHTVANPGFNEPTPGNTPADDALDMPLPSNNPFGAPPPKPPAAPSTFPGTPPQGAGQDNSGLPPPPPVPPPMLPPLQ